MLYKHEDEICRYLLEHGGKASLSEIAEALGTEPTDLMRAVESLKAKGVVAVEVLEALDFSEEGRVYLQEGLPEVLLFNKAQTPVRIADLPEKEQKVGIRWAKELGWITIAKGEVHAVKEKAREVEAYREAFARALEKPSRWEELFRRRKLLIPREEDRILVLRDAKKAKELAFELGRGASLLSAEMLAKGEIKLKPLSLAEMDPEYERVGFYHPLELLADRIREVFVEMGFEEMEGPMVAPAFWNFDALFQPQDHPARDLADTFYVEGEASLPERELVEKVRDVHEKFWKEPWSENVAKKMVLRTHTTLLSALTLAKMGREGRKTGKFFAIGRVFRNEATDYKHLSEFHQVEGIVVHSDATFSHLLGFLEAFYKRLGFSKIRFRPSYFPYTEPSVEIEAFYAPRNEWVEMGGAGIFRKQVSVTLAGVYPVLAWGLALERLLLFLAEIEDIRIPYQNNLDFIRRTRI